LLVAVDRAGRDENHPAHPHVAHGFHQADRAAHVDGVVFTRVEQRFRNRNARRQVVNAIDFLQQRPQFGPVVDVPAGKMNVLEQGFGITGGKVVDATHLMALARQLVGERRPKETSGAGDQEVHRVGL
jgi:hypothetical protein